MYSLHTRAHTYTCTHAHLRLLIVGQKESGFDVHAVVLAAHPWTGTRVCACVANHVRRGDADEAALHDTVQHLVLLRNDVVCAHVGQQFDENFSQFNVIEVALLDALLTDAVRCVTQQVWFCDTLFIFL